MKKISFAILILAVLSSALAMAEVANKPIDFNFNDLNSQIESLNQELSGTVLEGPLGKVFGDEKINIYISLENGKEQAVSLVTEDKKVKIISLEENEDPTFTVQTSEIVVKEVLSAKNPELALKKALQEKKVSYQARGFFRKFKLLFVSIFVKFNAEEEKAAEEKEETKTETMPAELPKEEVKTEAKEEKKEEVKVVAEEKKDEVKAEPAGPKTYTVEINAAGFNPSELKIKTNDLVEWKNVRNSNSLKLAMVLGTQECSAIKSGQFKTGEKFSWTFTKPMKCTVVDGITTTQVGKVVVE